MGGVKLTRVTLIHYLKLIYRSVFFIIAAVWYIKEKIGHHEVTLESNTSGKGVIFLRIIWAVFIIEMMFRFIPNKLESPGTQKVFRKNYVPTGKRRHVIQDNNAAAIAALAWLIPNGLIGALYLAGIFDQGTMMMFCLGYSICDLICALFYCPFQMWLLKNKCCSTCRIYNWDFPMMFTPLFFVPGFYTWSLLLIAIVLLVRWEVTYWKHPERFSRNTNAYLKCANCNEKQCIHKRRIHEISNGIIPIMDKPAGGRPAIGKNDIGRPGIGKNSRR